MNSVVGTLMTFNLRFGKRSNLFIGLGKETIPMRQSPKLVSPVKAGDMHPFQLLSDYLEYRYPIDKNESIVVYKRLFGLYKQATDFINNNKFLVNEFDTKVLHEIHNIVSFYEVRAWVSHRIVPPEQHAKNRKDDFGKDSTRTYDGSDYLDLVALVITTSALSPIMASLIYKTEVVSKQQAFCVAFEMTEEVLGDTLPIFKKYVGHVDLIQRAKSNLNAINNEMSFDDAIQVLSITTLYGRLSTHNILEDGGGKTLVTRLHQVIIGKTDKNDANSTKQRSNMRGDKVVSSFDLSTPYEYTGDIIQDYIWITEDPTLFVMQVYKDGLTKKQAEHFNTALKYVIGTPSPEIVAIMAIILRHFIAPEALTLLGIEREGHKPVIRSIDVCRATAYMEIVEKFPLIAQMIISKREEQISITLGDNLSQNKLKKESLRRYDFVEGMMTVVNNIANISKYDYTCKLPFLETEFLSVDRSMRVDIVDMINYINDKYVVDRANSICI